MLEETMILITKFDGRQVMLNPEQIQTIEATPDTVITLTTGIQIVVKDKVDELVAAFRSYKRSIFPLRAEVEKRT